MSAHMKKHHIESERNYVRLQHAGKVYQFPVKVAEKYLISDVINEPPLSPETIFAEINKKYTKPGALLRGIRARENLTQIEMAKKLKVTQSDISQMENGARRIGRSVAMRIQKLFGMSYRSFLS